MSLNPKVPSKIVYDGNSIDPMIKVLMVSNTTRTLALAASNRKYKSCR